MNASARPASATPIVLQLGEVPYAAALALQERLHAEAVESGREHIVVLTHPPTVTIGRGTAPEHLPMPQAELSARGIEVFEVGRGGSVTYHGPGQAVAYPIVALRRRGIGLHAYLRLLEEAAIRTVGRLGVSAFRRKGLTGVWTDTGKLAAVGVQVRRGVSMHGIALNVAPDLAAFGLIVPCGIAGESVTSLQALGVKATVDDTASALAADILAVLD